MHPADALDYHLMRLAHCRRLALAALGDVLTDDRTTAVRYADLERALEEIARVTDTTPQPSPFLSRLRRVVKGDVDV
jgi:ubiquinone biosynthesis protein UbiJ